MNFIHTLWIDYLKNKSTQKNIKNIYGLIYVYTFNINLCIYINFLFPFLIDIKYNGYFYDFKC